jgi:hypothetical protein
MSKARTIPFFDAIDRMQMADLVLITFDDGTSRPASSVGWEEEGEEKSDFVLGGTDTGMDDIYFTFGKRVKVDKDGNLLPSGYTVKVGTYDKRT